MLTVNGFTIVQSQLCGLFNFSVKSQIVKCQNGLFTCVALSPGATAAAMAFWAK